ncbi:hypothetical protein JG687_00004189, partial [Phytophthora cactorum]
MADAERRVQSMPHQRLDRDPSRLTTFPVPGFLAPTFQEPGSNAVSSETSKPVASPVKIRPPPMSAGNQYWMPDHLCHPVGVLAEDHEFILKAVENDTAFLNSINIVDYSMVMGLSYRQDNTGEKEEAPSEMTVGIIDYLRQFDLIKRVESVGKSV